MERDINDERIRQAVAHTETLRLPRQSLASFGMTNIHYYLVTEPAYKEIVGETCETVIREGKVIAERRICEVKGPFVQRDRIEDFSRAPVHYRDDVAVFALMKERDLVFHRVDGKRLNGIVADAETRKIGFGKDVIYAEHAVVSAGKQDLPVRLYPDCLDRAGMACVDDKSGFGKQDCRQYRTKQQQTSDLFHASSSSSQV